MPTQPPPIDSRTAGAIAQQVEMLLKIYTQEFGLEVDQGDPIRRALVGIFARFSELVIQRLNQVPEKNFLAFLNLLGASRLPPQPARVPLTFTLAAGSAVDGIVPARTQVAAPPTAGETDPVLFETEQELVVTAAKLESVFVRHPELDQYADYSPIATATPHLEVPVFRGDRPIQHGFYIAHDRLFGYPAIKALRLEINLEIAVPISRINPRDPRTVRWDYWDGTQYAALIPIQDGTQNLTQSGTIVFGDEAIANDSPPLPELKPHPVQGLEKRWLRCSFVEPIRDSDQPTSGMVRASQLPKISSIRIQPTLKQTNLAIAAGFTNQLPIEDLSKDFFPFGQTPRLGDALYLGNREAFSKGGATITLTVDLTMIEPPTGVARPTVDAELTWEYWNGKAWTALTVPNVTNALFRTTGTGKEVPFTLPTDVAATTVNGIENYWIRVRLTGGSYGTDGRYTPTQVQMGNTTITIHVFTPPQFVPPLINRLTIAYAVSPISPAPSTSLPEAITTDNDANYQQITPLPDKPFPAFFPFQPTTAKHPSLYLGFTLPPNRADFPNRPISLYASVVAVRYGDAIPLSPQKRGEGDDLERDRLQLEWQYWNGERWAKLIVEDGSENVTRPGVIQFLPPADFALKPAQAVEFGLPNRYWLKVEWQRGTYAIAPKLQGLRLNTTMAVQAETLRDEVLGSSDGSAHQRFRTVRRPILNGQQLQIREPELLSAEEAATIRHAEGDDAIAITYDAANRPQVIWVRWHEVPDFYASAPRDRHYVLDHFTGEVQFGNGTNGLIPPIGTGNVRLVRYQTGGGAIGNRPAAAIVQLKTTVPYVEKVTNLEPATGGADPETQASLIEREPRTLRHRFRAVALSDYEDLAKLASPDVERAKCVPLRDLNQLTHSSEPLSDVYGAVSVIIVPRSTSPKPLPSLELISRIQDYLRSHSSATAEIVVVGPQYVSVSVSAEIALTALEGASSVENAIHQKLASFLHPLTGGLDGTGWSFGREPHRSDFYQQIESIPGVDHIRSLSIDDNSDDPTIQSIKQTGLFLVHSGQHSIQLVFGD